MPQFDRVYRLTVGVEGGEGVAIEAKPKSAGLNVSFDIAKDLTTQTNKCHIKINNLSDATSKLMEREDSVCILEVGYSEDLGLRRIFVGEVTSAHSYYDGADKVTMLELSDGQKAIRDCVVTLSYADDVSRKKVIDDVAAEMGLLVTYAEGLLFTSFANGFSFIGAGRTCLDKVCTGTKMTWSIQNNVIQVIEDGGTTKMQALKLSPTSGLIGYPERLVKGPKKADLQKSDKQGKNEKKAGWAVKCLLQPTLNPGDLIYIESKVTSGWFKVESLHHRGEYLGQDWYTDMEIYEIGGGTSE